MPLKLQIELVGESRKGRGIVVCRATSDSVSALRRTWSMSVLSTIKIHKLMNPAWVSHHASVHYKRRFDKVDHLCNIYYSNLATTYRGYEKSVLGPATPRATIPRYPCLHITPRMVSRMSSVNTTKYLCNSFVDAYRSFLLNLNTKSMNRYITQRVSGRVAR